MSPTGSTAQDLIAECAALRADLAATRLLLHQAIVALRGAADRVEQEAP